MKEDPYSLGADKQTSVLAAKVLVFCVVTLLEPLDTSTVGHRGRNYPVGAFLMHAVG